MDGLKFMLESSRAETNKVSDGYTRRGPVMKIVVAFVRFFWIISNYITIASAYLFCMFLIWPLVLWNPSLYWSIEGVLCGWAYKLTAFWMWSGGYTVCEMGEDISDINDDVAIVMINHQATGDVPSLFYGFQHHNLTALWIMDVMFRYTNFGFMSLLRGDFFIESGRENRHLQGQLLKKHLLKIFWSRNRKWIILFPEGAFLAHRKASSQEYARKHGYPSLEHVTLPRFGAMQAIMETLGSAACHQNGINQGAINMPLKWIIDITIGYPGARPLDLQTIIAAQRQPFETVHYYRKFPVDQIPTDSEGFQKWMFDRFQEKEHLLEEFYTTGSFPEPSVHRNRTASMKIKRKTKLMMTTPELIVFNILVLVVGILPFYIGYCLFFWLMALVF